MNVAPQRVTTKSDINRSMTTGSKEAIRFTAALTNQAPRADAVEGPGKVD